MYLHRRHSNTQRQVWLSLCGVSWCSMFCAKTYTGLGKETLGGHTHTKNLVHTRNQEKGEVTLQETDTVSPVSVQSLRRRCGLAWPTSGSGTLSASVPAWDLLKEVPLSSLPPRKFGLRPNNREGTLTHSSNENLIKHFLSTAPPVRTRPSFPQSQSLSVGSFHKPLILYFRRKIE